MEEKTSATCGQTFEGLIGRAETLSPARQSHKVGEKARKQYYPWPNPKIRGPFSGNSKIWANRFIEKSPGRTNNGDIWRASTPTKVSHCRRYKNLLMANLRFPGRDKRHYLHGFSILNQFPQFNKKLGDICSLQPTFLHLLANNY